MRRYNKNKKLLEKNNVYLKDMEHDACGVGLVASTEGKKSRKVVEYGIQAFQKHSPIKAFFLLIKRVFRCHPLSSGGADPVPKS